MLFETHFATPLSLLLCTFRSRALHVPELSSSKVKPQFWDACRTKGTWKRYSRCCGYHLGSQSTISSSTSATCTPANSHSAVNEYYNLVSQISQHYGVNEQVSKCWAHSKVFTPALVAILLYHSLIPGLVLLLIWHVHVYTASSITCDTEIDPHSGWFGVWGRDYPLLPRWQNKTNNQTRTRNAAVECLWNFTNLASFPDRIPSLELH